MSACYMHEYGTVHCSMRNLVMVISSIKNGSPYSGNYPLSVAPKGLCLEIFWLGWFCVSLVQVTISCCEIMVLLLCYVQKSVL